MSLENILKNKESLPTRENQILAKQTQSMGWVHVVGLGALRAVLIPPGLILLSFGKDIFRQENFSAFKLVSK